MEIPCLELEDPKLAARVIDLVGSLVITAEKQEKMIEVFEKELDLGLQHGLSGQAFWELRNGDGHVNWLSHAVYVILM